MRILFITSNRIGDAVLSTGLLRHLLEKYPQARFTIACGPAAASLFQAMPNLERVIVMTKRPWAGHWLRLWRATVARRWSLLIDLRGSIIGQFLVVDRRHVLTGSGRSQHRVRHLAGLLKLREPPAPQLWSTPEQQAAARQLLPDGEPVLAVGPTANWIGKQWPAASFAEAVRRLTAADGILPGARIAVFGAAGERTMAEPLLASIPPARRIDLVGKLDLPSVYACLQRAAFYLGNDSGLMHMAAAAGIPTLGLFGPSREDHYAPWGPHAAFVRTPESLQQIIGQPGYDHRQRVSHMASLQVETVVAAAVDLWHRVAADRMDSVERPAP